MVEHNVAKVLSNGMPIAQIEATNEGTGSKQADDDKAGGLANSIILSKHTKVRLTSNLWLSAGLTNGAAGTVTHILYKEGHAPPELPLAVIVSFDNYKGPTLLPDYPSSVPIVPIRRTWNQNLPKDKQCARTMLPLMLGYALSIHKLQGATYDKVIVNVGDTEFALGITHVGVTRTKSFEGLAFDPFPNF